MRELIKVKNDINEVNKDKILTKIGLMAFTRNFGGLSNSLDIINLSLDSFLLSTKDTPISNIKSNKKFIKKI